MIYKLFLLALSGAVGTLARYTLAGAAQRTFGPDFPWGTMVVNVFGCLVAGFLWAVFENRLVVTGASRTAILVGFMGSFTTFSTFILETGQLLRGNQMMAAALNLVTQNVVGLVFLFIGIALGRML